MYYHNFNVDFTQAEDAEVSYEEPQLLKSNRKFSFEPLPPSFQQKIKASNKRFISSGMKA